MKFISCCFFLLKFVFQKSIFFFCNCELRTEVYVRNVKHSVNNCKSCTFYSKIEIDLCCSAECPKLATLNKTSGVITSPFYPRNYPSNQRCSWQITASKGNHVVLIIEYMYIQQCGVSCPCDHLEIQNGSSFDGLYHLGGRRCGHHRYYCYRYRYPYYYRHCFYWPLIFLSYRESLKVLFLSDGSSTKMYPGFKATYIQVNQSAMITGNS